MNNNLLFITTSTYNGLTNYQILNFEINITITDICKGK